MLAWGLDSLKLSTWRPYGYPQCLLIPYIIPSTIQIVGEQEYLRPYVHGGSNMVN